MADTLEKPDGTEFTFDPLVEFPCAFCEGTVTAGLTNGEDETLLHTEPHCQQFEQLSLNDYLEQNRLALEAQTKN